MLDNSGKTQKQIYLYGQLDGLFREQFVACKKLSEGRLGAWGRNRIAARDKRIMRVFEKLLQEEGGQKRPDSIFQAKWVRQELS